MVSVIILGTGEVGSAALHYLLEVEGINRIAIGDINLGQSETLKQKYKDRAHRINCVEVDVTDVENTASVLSKYDYVLNCIGPYFLFARPVFEASLQAGVTYIDVNDDWEPTLDLLSLNEKAKAERMCAVLGMGASPGIANILAKAAMAELPDATSLITAWREDMAHTGYSAAKEHWLHQCSGEITIWKDGKQQSVKPLQSFEIDFPGKGKTLLHYVGHPEPITLPMHFEHLDFSVNAMSCPPGLIETLKRIAEAIDNKKVSVKEAAHQFETFHDPNSDMTSPGLPGLFAQAQHKDGRNVTAVLTQYPSELGPVTAAPMIAALRLMIKQKINEHGVHTPEMLFSPKALLREFSLVIGEQGAVWELYK